MYKKLISIILIIAFLNLLGCYSTKSFTVPELKQVEEKEDKPNDIYVRTKDGQEYHYPDSNFYIENDTLYVSVKAKELPFEGKFAIWEIKSIQFEDFGSKYPSPMMVSQYQKIKSESDEPNEIYLIKNDFTKYHFIEPYYYFENDTLYGMGKLISYREQQLDIKIALSDTESIQSEYLNLANTILLVLGISVISLAVVVAIAGSSGDYDIK